MKKAVFFASVLLAGLSYKASDAQVRLHIGVNFGTPVYAPAPVADVQYSDADDYYYLPDADAYYSVPEHVYYYMNDNRWVSAPYLPGRFHDFDWRYARHYEVRAPRPFMHHDVYRERFGGFAGGNPNWRAQDNRYRGGDFGPNRFEHGGFNNGGDYARRQDYNRGQQGYGQYNGGYGNNRGNYNNAPAQPQNNGGYGQPQDNYNRGNNGQQQGQYNNGSYNQGGQGQYRGQGGNQNGNWQGQGQNSQPSNSNSNEHNRGSFNGQQQHFADNNGPAYNRQNGFTRQARF